MLVRKEQIDVFEAEAEVRGIGRLARFARARFPLEYGHIADWELQRMVMRVRSAAGQYGITREDNLRTMVEFSVLYGEAFHLEPWAACVLQLNLHPPDKVALLRDRAGF
jgi:hypothetical protein